MNLVKHDTAKVHAFKDGRPLCGGGNHAKSVKWQTDFGPVNCDRCQEIHKHQTSMQEPMIEIEKAAKVYADKHDTLSSVVTLLNQQIEQIKRAALPDIKRAVAATADKQATLIALVESHRALFTKPKSVVFHGIRIGLRKGKGGVNWDDDDQVVSLIRKNLPEQFDVLVKVTEKPRAKALEELEVSDLMALGCTVEGTEDVAFVRAATSDVDKIVNALLKGATEEEAS